jgi:hypothetical protein
MSSENEKCQILSDKIKEMCLDAGRITVAQVPIGFIASHGGIKEFMGFPVEEADVEHITFMLHISLDGE